RLINVICDNALLAAYTDDIKQVTPKIVKVVFTDMEKSYGKDRALDKAVRPNYAPKRYRFLKNIVFVFILCLVGVLLAWSIFTRYTSAQISSGDSPILQLESGCDDPSENKNTFEQQHSKHAPPSNRAKIALEDVDSNHQTSPIPPPAANSGKPSGIWVKVSNGDTLAALTAEYYGMIDPHIMQAVRDANSALEDINLIYEGQQIFLPNVNLPSRVLYSVSVASYHSIDEAQAVFTDLMGTKYEAAIYPYVDAQGKRWYRITIGTFLLKEEADEYALHLKQKGFLYARPLKISMEE
ncbi:MAG: SPOR domain-containing protein, partial [Deltaproteobacteria bacterium]|nr:SPOR domain-containing protein [Deltaproteobacteria bacterium]